MNLIRFEDAAGRVQYGEPLGDAFEKARVLRGCPWGDYEITDKTVAVRRVLAPLRPPDIIAIGLNYRQHAVESGATLPEAPLVFAKLTSSVIGPGDSIRLPTDAPDEVDYEAELAVIIRTTARRVCEADALKHVLGYTCANDVSARDCQTRRDRQWTRAKSFDTFCPLGPCVVIDPAMDPDALPIRCRLNGEVVQDSNTADMIFSVPRLISYLSHQFTLAPGTVILTGTPQGVGFGRKPPRYLRPGDRVAVDIEGIGTLDNPVENDR